MKQQDFTGLVPEQYTGKEIEAEASVELMDESQASLFYETAKERLLNVNNWHEVAGLISAKFQVISPEGGEVSRHAEKGDYFKIDIPGPGSKEGDGFDWVIVEDMKEVNDGEIECIGFRVRPSKNPFGDKPETAHFYSHESTSTFTVTREGKTVRAWIIDRNLSPNVNPESLADKIRHSAVGSGAIGIFSKIQWQGLADGLIQQSHDTALAKSF